MHSKRTQLIKDAKDCVNLIKYGKYRRGESQNIGKGLNCYGLFDLVLRSSGLKQGDNPPTHIWDLWDLLRPTETPEPGDLVFKDGPKGIRPVHVGIYNGETAIHSSKKYGRVVETPIGYFSPIKGYRSILTYLNFEESRVRETFFLLRSGHGMPVSYRGSSRRHSYQTL